MMKYLSCRQKVMMITVKMMEMALSTLKLKMKMSTIMQKVAKMMT